LIRIYPDGETLSRAAADLFVHRAEEAVAAQGAFTVALSGGDTPRRTYELLAEPAFAERVAWPRVHVFWGDERCVPLDDSRSNARMARQVWLDRVPLPTAQIHALSCHPSPESGAAGYERQLRAFFKGRPPRFDLVFLGLGENGHTASLFPRSSALAEQVRWAVAVYVPEQDLYRVTLTPVILNEAVLIAFLVIGAAKARVLKEVRDGPLDPERLPAQLIQPREGQLLWLADRKAAALLEAGNRD
jgi:6-phosphogluconolactonase